MERSKGTKVRKDSTSFSIGAAELAILDQVSEQTMISKSAIVRRLVQKFAKSEFLDKKSA